MVGDVAFILARRFYLDAVSSSVKAWSYISTYDYGTPVLGTCHATDILAMYYGVASTISVNDMFIRYISFINFLDPNVLPARTSSLYQSWPQYNVTARQLLSFGALGTSTIADTFRPSSYSSFKADYSQFKM